MKNAENERGIDGEIEEERKRKQQRGHREDREEGGQTAAASHSSCVTTPHSYNTYIHIHDRSCISHTYKVHRNKPYPLPPLRAT